MEDAVEIFEAIEAGDVERVRESARAPEARGARNAEGVSPLLEACYLGRHDLVDAILDSDPELDLFEAAALGRGERARELLDADPALARGFSPDGYTALALASFFAQAALVRLLLSRGADVTAAARNPMRVMPLHAATASGQHEIARLLLERDAPVDARQQGGFTALQAAAQNGDEELVDLLLRHRADPALANDAGATAAHLAEQAGHDELARRLQP